MEQFVKNANKVSFTNYERYSAIEGQKLIPNIRLQRIFEGNDYNMRVGMVGCALSHIKLWIELLYSDYNEFFILEDDAEFVENFTNKYNEMYDISKSKDWDIIYIGHHKKHIDSFESFVQKPNIEKWNANTSLCNSLGGTFAYLINKKGAKKLLEFINSRGLTNGIDTVQQKSADILNVYYCYPCLVTSKCYRHNDTSVDSDISYNYNSLSLSDEDRIKLEITEHNLKFIDKQLLERIIDTQSDLIMKENNYHTHIDNNLDTILVSKLKNLKTHIHYMIANKYVVLLHKKYKYIERLKINDLFTLDDCILYK